MKRAIVGLALLAAAAAAGAQSTAAAVAATPPGGTVRLTFQEAMARAMRVNNTIERSRADVGVAEANRQQLLSNVLPRVTATGATTRNSTSATFGGGSSGGPSTPVTILSQNDWNYGVVLSQPVFAGRRELRAYSQANIGIENAQQGVLETEDAVLLRVASNYLAVVNSDARIDIEKHNIELAEKRRTQAQAFYEAGEVTKVDVLRAETSIKSSQRALAVAEQTREAAVSRLRADLDMDGGIDVVNPAHALPAIPDESALITRAQTSRPDVELAANNVRIAQLEVQKQRGFWLPVVTFDGGYLAQKSSFPAPHRTYGALRFNVPILQSGEVEARVAQAKERELQSKLDLDTTRVNAREDVRTAVVNLHAAETTLGLAREQLAAAEAEYQQAFELYRAQESTSLDVATSEASLADARRAVAEETLNRDLAELRVWYAAGEIKPAVGITGTTETPSPVKSGALESTPPERAETNQSGVKQ